MAKKYCEAIFMTKRLKTREVLVGNVGIGGKNPVRIQSMTTSNTRNVQETLEQVLKLADAGCEIVRITVQGMKEAEACEEIKNGLIQRGCNIPLVADIHFYPPAAMRVADYVEKIRVNPGNFVDKRASFKVIEYDDISYVKELKKIEEKFSPLVIKCKLLKRAMRIGANHGSLSDRIMNRYGDTPRGMVESALEFAHICRKYDYHDFVFSMKASNPLVMIQAYRLLVAEMIQLNWDYPIHLGVTEAGEGEDGRIKSAMGIGTLLLDGIGDTIRVSLTEDPWFEIDPCQRLIKLANQYSGKGVDFFVEKHRHFQEITKRPIIYSKGVPLHRNGTVCVTVRPEEMKKNHFYSSIGCDLQAGKPRLKISSADSIVLLEFSQDPFVHQIIKNLHETGIGIFTSYDWPGSVQIKSLTEASEHSKIQSQTERFTVKLPQMSAAPIALILRNEVESDWHKISSLKPDVILLSPPNNRLHYARHFFDWLREKKITTPVILNFQYTCSKEDLIIQASAELGALLCDGLGEGLWIESAHDTDFIRNLSFNILQAARMRTFKTDFISCPSCGRTLFDLQEVTKRIRKRTSHLPGVKIAIMGCIVNGPGEMADADFGYVGSKPRMIDLYVGKQCVERDIDFDEADERLIELIKKHGRWIEPS